MTLRGWAPSFLPSDLLFLIESLLDPDWDDGFRIPLVAVYDELERRSSLDL